MPVPSTPISFVLAVAAGFAVYHAKQETQRLDRGIARTLAAVEEQRTRITQLQVQWAVLNEGERLAGLSQRHLPSLAPVRLDQVATVPDLDRRLPPPAAPAVAASVRASADPSAPVPWQPMVAGR